MAAKRQRVPPYVERVITPSGAARFRGWYREGGKRKKLKLRESPEEAYRDAIEARAKVEKADSNQGVTLGAMFERVIEDAATNRSDGHCRWLRGQRDAILKVLRRNTPIHSLTADDLRQLVRLRRGQVSASTIGHHRRALSILFKQAMRDGFVTQDTTKLLTWPTIHKKEPDVLSWDEVKDGLRAVESRLPGSQDAYDLFRFTILTGWRKKEISMLMVGDVDLSGGTMTVKGKRRPESTAIPSGALEILERRMEDRDPEELIFPKGYEWIGNTFRYWSRVLEDRRWHCHALRHSLGTELARRGEHLTVIQKVMRHSTIEQSAWYVHRSSEEARRAQDSLDI